MAKLTQQEKDFFALLAEYREDHEDRGPSIKLCSTRAFYRCHYMSHRTREDQENLMLVVQFFSHQRQIVFDGDFAVELDNQPFHVPVRIVRYDRETESNGYLYLVKLQGNTALWKEL